MRRGTRRTAAGRTRTCAAGRSCEVLPVVVGPDRRAPAGWGQLVGARGELLDESAARGDEGLGGLCSAQQHWLEAAAHLTWLMRCVTQDPKSTYQPGCFV